MPPKSSRRGNNALKAQWLEQTETQRTALKLHRMGLTVMPLPYGSKEPAVKENGRVYHMRWKQFYHQRMSEGGLYHAFKGRCNIAVIARDGFFFIDCETRNALEWCIAELLKRSIVGYVVYSGGAKGGGHIYLCSEGGAVENIALARSEQGQTAGRMVNIEIRGNREYVVGEGSVHPITGTIYEPKADNPDLIPVVTLERLDFFTDMHGQTITLKLKRTTKPRPKYTDPRMNTAIHDYLANGNSLPEGVRNDTLNRIAWQMHQRGYSDAEIIDSAGPVAIRGGQTERAVRETIRSACNTSIEPPAATNSKHHARQQYCAAVRQYSYQHAWKGANGSTDRKVFEAMILRCELGGYPAKGSKTVLRTGAQARVPSSYVFRGTVREIAELAHAHHQTIEKSLRRLQDVGLIAQVGKDDSAALPRKARLWRFSGEAATSAKTAHCVTPILEDCSVLNSQSSDVLERGAIGINGMRIYRLLVASAEPITAADIALQTNLSASQVAYILRPDNPLRANNLVLRQGKKGYSAMPATNAKFDEIAVRTGKAGKSQKRKDRNADERAVQLENMVIKWREKYDTLNYTILDEQPKPHKSAKRAPIIQLDVEPLEPPLERNLEPAEYIDNAIKLGANPFSKSSE